VQLWYVSTDEVNAAVAIELAARSGVAVILADARRLSPRSQLGVVCDFDFLPGGYASVCRLVAGGRLLAVHSYNLRGRRARALRAAGVIVCRRLTARLFRRLKVAGTSRAARPGWVGPLAGGDA
jgi:hypothetical protein